MNLLGAADIDRPYSTTLVHLISDGLNFSSHLHYLYLYSEAGFTTRLGRDNILIIFSLR